MVEMKDLIEYGVGGVLSASLGTLVVLSIGRRSALKLVEGQLSRFRNKTELELELKKSMTMIYSITSNSVYFGLLGTVLGMIVVLTQVGSADMSGLIASLAFPLLSTAAALVVAIIGTFLFYSLNDEIDTVEKKWDIAHGHAAESKEKVGRRNMSTGDDDGFED
jgi:biopolymer transport protein ExbB